MLHNFSQVEYVETVFFSQNKSVFVQLLKSVGVVVLSDGIASVGDLNFLMRRVIEHVRIKLVVTQKICDLSVLALHDVAI